MTEAWNQLIHTALLGTERARLADTALPPQLAGLAWEGLDAEDRFLHLAAALLNYHHSGWEPSRKEATPDPAPAETQPYCSPAAAQLLTDLLEIDSAPLLRLWLQACAAHNALVQPQLLPPLLERAARLEELQPFTAAVCGKRGAWLARYNPNWHFEKGEPEDVWETGTLAQRSAFLRRLRATDAGAARALLQQVWPAEGAAARAELLATLEVGLGDADESWLEGLRTDKSSKVREEALRLLKRLPEGRILQRYREVLAGAVALKKERALLGLSSRTVLEFDPPTGDDALYATGLVKTSSEKGLSDAAYLLQQLTAAVPPRFWEDHLRLTPAELLPLLQKHPVGQQLEPALAQAAAEFGDAAWARVLAQSGKTFYPALLPLLPAEEWEAYAGTHFTSEAPALLAAARALPGTWPPALALALLRHTASNGYSYPKSFFNNIAHHIPASVAADLGACAPPEPYLRDLWSSNSEHLLRLLSLRQNINQVFL